MRLYLVRHAIAEETSATGRDEDRELTADGSAKMARHAEALRALDVDLDAVWTSPLARARQTAELLASAFDLAGKVRIEAELAPHGDQSALLEAVRRADPGAELALVGHAPDLGVLAMRLVGGRPGAGIELKKGGVACLEIDLAPTPPRGQLLWLLPPRALRRAAP